MRNQIGKSDRAWSSTFTRHRSASVTLRADSFRSKAAFEATESRDGRRARLRFGELRIDFRAALVFRGDRPLDLSALEYKLLKYFVQNRGALLSRDELLDKVWGEEVVVDPRNIDVHIRWLRAQLEGEPDGSGLIQTVHGVGYRFAGELGPGVAYSAGQEGTRSDFNQSDARY